MDRVLVLTPSSGVRVVVGMEVVVDGVEASYVLFSFALDTLDVFVVVVVVDELRPPRPLPLPLLPRPLPLSLPRIPVAAEEDEMDEELVIAVVVREGGVTA